MTDEAPTVLIVAAEGPERDALLEPAGAVGRCVVRDAAGAALDAAGGADLAIIDDRVAADAVELARRMSGAEGVTVLVITEPGGAAAALEGGCDDAMVRPVDGAELAARLRSLASHRALHERLERAAAELRELHSIRQTLAALVVHDLRNPISAIQGNVDLVREILADPDPMVADSLGDIRQLTDKALSLVASLLDVEQIEEGLLRAQRAPASVRACVEQAALPHRQAVRGRALDLRLNVPADLRCSFDRELTSRLIENLLDNAVRYATRGGRVVVTAGMQDSALLLRVGNDGPAIPPAERDKIFDRYYRIEARRAGARANRGLGLYFCKLAAQAHGGTIAVTETPDLPAVFEVRLPAEP